MRQMVQSAFVIARRDYTATVFSKTFLLFLLGPLVALGFGAVFGAAGGRADDLALRPVIAVVGTADETAAFRAAYARTTGRIGTDALPELRIEAPARDRDKQARALLAETKRSVSLVLTGLPAAPRLTGPERKIEQLSDEVKLVLDDAATADALAKARVTRPETTIAHTVIDPAGGSTSSARHLVARSAQSLLFFLLIILSGALLSNLVEEKSNKVIEVLAAAVPIDAIFFGKLVAMLCVSLTGIVIWATAAAAAVVVLIPDGIPIPIPAVGWPLFGALGFGYFVTSYLLLGGVFIGIGAQANSAREVQTLSMPVTMSQLAVFALASATVNDITGPWGLFAQLFPLSSPIAMLGRAAQEPVLWPHLLALAWQALWVIIIVRFAASRFRTGVLKSGGPRRKRFSRGKAVATP
jgi:ABC-2 type transport system permease protein